MKQMIYYVASQQSTTGIQQYVVGRVADLWCKRWPTISVPSQVLFSSQYRTVRVSFIFLIFVKVKRLHPTLARANSFCTIYVNSSDNFGVQQRTIPDIRLLVRELVSGLLPPPQAQVVLLFLLLARPPAWFTHRPRTGLQVGSRHCASSI